MCAWLSVSDSGESYFRYGSNHSCVIKQSQKRLAKFFSQQNFRIWTKQHTWPSCLVIIKNCHKLLQDLFPEIILDCLFLDGVIIDSN